MKNSINEIQEVLNNYFLALHEGNTKSLQTVFIASPFIMGDKKGTLYHKSFKDYLEDVRKRTSPKAQQQQFSMQTHTISVTKNIATATVQVPLYEYNYYDVLHLVHFGGSWKIASKVFTHV